MTADPKRAVRPPVYAFNILLLGGGVFATDGVTSLRINDAFDPADVTGPTEAARAAGENALRWNGVSIDRDVVKAILRTTTAARYPFVQLTAELDGSWSAIATDKYGDSETRVAVRFTPKPAKFSTA